MVNSSQKIVFLDRDGVINEYPGDTKYVTRWREFKFLSGAVQAVKKLKEYNFRVFIVSNQAGVGKGLYSQNDLNYITSKMLAYFKKNKAFIDGVYYCTHRKEENCSCRKPKTGLLKKALEDNKIEKFKECYFIGDSFIDMNTARAFGCKSILVLSGKEKISNRRNWEFEPDFIFDNLLVAVHYIVSRHGK